MRWREPAYGGGMSTSPAPLALERGQEALGAAKLTPACRHSCFCPAWPSASSVRVWPSARALLSAAIRGGLVDSVCLSCDGGAAVKGVQLLLHDPLCSAPPGDVLQLSLPLRGSGLFPGPWVAASRGCGWYPAHVHSQGKRPSASA